MTLPRRAPRSIALQLGLVLAMALTAASAAAQPAPRTERCHYAAELTPALRLEIEVTCFGPGPHRLGIGQRFQARHVVLRGPGSDTRIENGGEVVTLHGRDGTARLRYGFDLDAFARETDAVTIAQKHGESVAALLWTYLLRPEEPEALLTLAVTAPPGLGFATALVERDGAFAIRNRDLRFAGYTVFGRFGTHRVAVPAPGALQPGIVRAAGGRGAIDIAILDGPLELPPEAVTAWIGDAAAIVADYWHGFPVARALVVVVPVPNRPGVVFGRVVGGGGATAMIQLGAQARPPQLYGDWILVHEMVHLGSPFVFDGAAWLMEGIATYAEPIIRARAGWLRPEEVWAEFARDMPRGLDGVGREGLAKVSRRGLYWGGAIFMLLADIDIRRRTGGRMGLEHCLRAVLREGGDTTQRWTASRMIAACDGATGTDTMTQLAARHVQAATAVDLEALWRELGVIRAEGGIRLDDTAPLAAIRRAIIDGGADAIPGSGARRRDL